MQLKFGLKARRRLNASSLYDGAMRAIYHVALKSRQRFFIRLINDSDDDENNNNSDDGDVERKMR